MPDNFPQSATINLITHDAKTGDVTLVLVETERWGSDGERLPQLCAKLDSYIQYVLSGQLARDYQFLGGRRVRFRIDSHYPLGVKEVSFLYHYRTEELETRGILLDVHEIGVRSFLKRSLRKKY